MSAVLSLHALLVQKVLALLVQKDELPIEKGLRERGTQFTCFTGTKVQIVTLEELQTGRRRRKS